MQCAFRELGYVDKCLTRCKPIEQIYSSSGLNQLESLIASSNVIGSSILFNSYDKIREHSSGIENIAIKSATGLINFMLPSNLKNYIIDGNEKIRQMELNRADFDSYLFEVGEIGEEMFDRSAQSTKGKYNRQYVREVGRNVAQTTILLDAHKDLAQDYVNKHYNPFFGIKPEETNRIIQKSKDNLGKILSVSPTLPLLAMNLVQEDEKLCTENPCSMLASTIALGVIVVFCCTFFYKSYKHASDKCSSWS